MEVSGGIEEGFIREWTPCSHILNLIPPRIQTGIFSSELCLTCVDAVSEYIALGTNVGLVYWYDRKKGNIQRLRCEGLLLPARAGLVTQKKSLESNKYDHECNPIYMEGLHAAVVVTGRLLPVTTTACKPVETSGKYKASNSPITYVKIVSTVDYMVGAGNTAGQVTVFQIPKEHPDNIPDNFKPKVEPKVERYTIGDLHKSKITAIEWSKNGMRLFSGDKNGVIIMTEIDFYMHLCKSAEIVNEQHEIVQMSWYQNCLLVSSVFRGIVCERRDGRWRVSQIGKRERKTLCAVGAVWQYSYASGGAPRAYCARPGLRLWRADPEGNVLQTLLFKEAVSNPLTEAELLTPAAARAPGEPRLGPLHVFRERFLCAHDERALLLLDPERQQCVACVDRLRRILSVSVNKDEIFVLEGPRSLVRLAHAPEPAALIPEDPLNMMTKSLTSSLQHAVSTTTTLIDQTVPFISSVLEQPISMFTKNELIETTVPGEECFELPPIKHLPTDISGEVLESIINEFRDVSSDVEEIRRAKSEELQRKLKLYNSYMERSDVELIHSSRRSRRREGGSGGNTPRRATPVRKDGVTTAPCVMQVSVYNDPQQNDELLEQEIEEKEKILAKMLNLESLSITASTPDQNITKTDLTYTDNPTYKHTETNTNTNTPNHTNKVKTQISDNKTDLVPKVMKLPNNWNLNLELKLDMKNGFKDRLVSPDEHLDSEWEII